MQVSSVPLYYSHITSGIEQLENRKDKYMYHRLKFLKQYCLPVQHKIEQTKQQIKETKQLLKNQDILIDNEKDVAVMRAHIKQYEQTKHYYLMHIDQYEQKYLQMKTRNEKLRRWIQSAMSQISELSKDQFKNVQQIIREQEEYRENSYSRPLQKSRASSSLPPLMHPTKNYNNRVVQKMKQQLQRSSIQMQASNVSRWKDIQKSVIHNPESLETVQQRVTRFDQTQSLFKECFEKKKQQIQKSVSQLQAKLIQNKEIFLKVCQVIGEKTGKITEQQFMQLTSDEIVTLFISFGWLNRKLAFQFVTKRKQMIQYVKRKNKIKKLSLKRS